MAINGSLFKVYSSQTGSGTFLSERCQTDATLTISVNTETEEPCKPDTEDANFLAWEEPTATTRAWSVTFSKRVFLDAVAEAGISLFNEVIDGNIELFIEVKTNSTVEDFNQIYKGKVLITEATLNMPSSGLATEDFTLTGVGALTHSEVPVSGGIIPNPPTNGIVDDINKTFTFTESI